MRIRLLEAFVEITSGPKKGTKLPIFKVEAKKGRRVILEHLFTDRKQANAFFDLCKSLPIDSFETFEF